MQTTRYPRMPVKTFSTVPEMPWKVCSNERSNVHYWLSKIENFLFWFACYQAIGTKTGWMKRGKEQKMNQTSSIISLNLPLHARTPLSLVSGCENFSIASAFRLMMMKNFKFKLNQFLPPNQFSVFHNLIQIPIFQPLIQVATPTGVLSHYASLQVVVPEAFILGSGELHVDMGSALNLVCIIEKVIWIYWLMHSCANEAAFVLSVEHHLISSLSLSRVQRRPSMCIGSGITTW